MNKEELQQKVSQAVAHFWSTRETQHGSQGKKTGEHDRGSRGAVTGGAQLDGFVRLVAALVADAGVPEAHLYFSKRKATYLPGFFRPTKSWDLLVVADDCLLACLEFKSQVGSFGNNFNNRSEEAIGSATDFWTAYREGAFCESPRPWLGYFMLLQEAPASTRPVAAEEPHFPVFEEFRGASYAKRYELLCQRLVRERLYDAACLLLSERQDGREGKYQEPSAELSFTNLAVSLTAHANAYARFSDS